VSKHQSASWWVRPAVRVRRGPTTNPAKAGYSSALEPSDLLDWWCDGQLTDPYLRSIDRALGIGDRVLSAVMTCRVIRGGLAMPSTPSATPSRRRSSTCSWTRQRSRRGRKTTSSRPSPGSAQGRCARSGPTVCTSKHQPDTSVKHRLELAGPTEKGACRLAPLTRNHSLGSERYTAPVS
jgi:hypothetical protein